MFDQESASHSSMRENSLVFVEAESIRKAKEQVTVAKRLLSDDSSSYSEMQEGNLKDLGPVPESRLQPIILQKRLLDAGLEESFYCSSITSESSKKETHTILSAVEDDKDDSEAMAFMRLSSPERRRYQRFRTVNDG